MSKIIKTYIDSEGRTFISEDGTDKDLEYQSNPDIGEVLALREVVSDDGDHIEDGRSSFIQCSGRFYSFVDGRWVTDSDDLYGSNQIQMQESGLTGVDPVFEWEHLGTPLPKGTRIKNLNFVCRTNNIQIQDFELVVVQRKPDDQSRWVTGIDNDAEMQNIVLVRELWKNLVGDFSGNMNDIHGASIPINITIDDFSMISIYIKPIEVNTATRYIYATWTWEIL